MFFLSPRAARKGKERRENRTSTRSLTDRASDYGSEGCRFESCRVHSRSKAPDESPGPSSFRAVQQRSTATRSAGAAHGFRQLAEGLAHVSVAGVGVDLH